MNANNDQFIMQTHQAQFAEDVISGLSLVAKTLPCKWFYDAAGSALFEQITDTAEYYPTRVETRLLQSLTSKLTQDIPDLSLIIEPGSGSSVKTRLLLASQPKLREYMPMDISAEFLFACAADLEIEFPNLTISPFVCDFTALNQALEFGNHPQRMVFFPGSTIGNFNTAEAQALLNNIRVMAGKGAWMLIGVDMTQNTTQLLNAYDDASGITAAFNKNLLVRINRELGADFVLENFAHRAIFNTAEHRIEMHLVSQQAQTVHVAGHVFHFGQGEFIHTENAHKYPKAMFEKLLLAAGWLVKDVWQDTTESNFGLFLVKAKD